MWGEAEQAAFDRDGVVRLRGAVDSTAVGAMADAVWGFLGAHAGIDRVDPSTWPRGAPGVSLKRLKRSRTLRDGVVSPAVEDTMRGLFGGDGWHASRSGPQILVTFPSGEPWVVPSSPWHMDAGFADDLVPVPAVKTFVVLESLAPRGGATMTLAGSHRLQAAYAASVGEDERGGGLESWSKLLRRDPWTDRLQRAGGEPERSASLLGGEVDVDGVPLRLVELTGEPGDVWLTHKHLYHCPSTCSTDRPRIVVSMLATRGGRP